MSDNTHVAADALRREFVAKAEYYEDEHCRLDAIGPTAAMRAGVAMGAADAYRFAARRIRELFEAATPDGEAK